MSDAGARRFRFALYLKAYAAEFREILEPYIQEISRLNQEVARVSSEKAVLESELAKPKYDTAKDMMDGLDDTPKSPALELEDQYRRINP